jgi:competence ComEA-like helix-hairpin-helix protein
MDDSMSRHLFFAALILSTMSAATAVTFADRQAKPVDATSSPAKDDAQRDEELATAGKKAADEICTSCHVIDDVTSSRRTVREWTDVVATMVDRGAGGTDEQIATIKQYLMRYYGMVWVNTASAKDLSSVLGLSSKEADAVVEYRKAHGRFADAAALSSVPGIDTSKITAQPDALRFD